MAGVVTVCVYCEETVCVLGSHRALFFHFQYVTDIVFFWWAVWPVPLQAEPIDPSLEQLRALWRCRDAARGQHVNRFTELTTTEWTQTHVQLKKKSLEGWLNKYSHTHTPHVAIGSVCTHTWHPCRFWLLGGMSIWMLARAWSPCTASEGHSSIAQTVPYLYPAHTQPFKYTKGQSYNYTSNYSHFVPKHKTWCFICLKKKKHPERHTDRKSAKSKAKSKPFS